MLSALVPLLAAGILTGSIGGIIGVRAAGSAIAFAFAIAYWSILGWPLLPPRTSLHKIIYIALLSLVLGAVLDALRDRVSIMLVACIWPGVLVVWLGWQQFVGFAALDLARLALLWVAGALIFNRLVALREAAIVAPTMVLVAGIGLSVVALIGAAASLSQLAAAVAAATGGFLIWNWPKQRYPFSMVTLFGAASVLFSVGAAMVLFTRASALAGATLLLVFATGSVRHIIPLVGRPIWGPVAYGAIASIPMLLAVAIAYFAATAAAEY